MATPLEFKALAPSWRMAAVFGLRRACVSIARRLCVPQYPTAYSLIIFFFSSFIILKRDAMRHEDSNPFSFKEIPMARGSP
ncbi:MAG: hypothetical protein JWM59_2589 [Verrucomicrobiales bacterium]|nr:hypothetical protein [Verrucomicrobiales bacterium]